MKKGVKINWKILVVCFFIVYGIAFLGSVFTSGNTNTPWYQGIKTAITPPNYVFPIVWNILFFLIALSLYFAWLRAGKNQKKIVALAFGINLFLNVLWSYLFFELKKPNYSFFELSLLWVSIWFMIAVTGKIDRKASWLLVPYLAWVLFAGILNYLIAFG